MGLLLRTDCLRARAHLEHNVSHFFLTAVAVRLDKLLRSVV
jgi:hypothetical protein